MKSQNILANIVRECLKSFKPGYFKELIKLNDQNLLYMVYRIYRLNKHNFEFHRNINVVKNSPFGNFPIYNFHLNNYEHIVLPLFLKSIYCENIDKDLFQFDISDPALEDAFLNEMKNSFVGFLDGFRNIYVHKDSEIFINWDYNVNTAVLEYSLTLLDKYNEMYAYIYDHDKGRVIKYKK